jgi:protein TonB
MISFTINADGSIENLKLEDSSGRDMLDDAALKIITDKMQSRFHRFPERIQRDSWNIRVPVSYRLN